MKTVVKDYRKELKHWDQHGLRRHLRSLEGAQGPRINIDGQELLNFCSNNYLGLADDPRLKQAVIRSMDTEGWGSGASRLVCGTLSTHCQLEKRIAQFKGAERALLFNSGYTANLGIIPALFGRGDIIFSDRLNHASIIDGILLSQAKLQRYPHKDMTALEKIIEAARDYDKKLIVTDTVFSMDGDVAPLDTIVRLAKKYGCMVMVDEAHAFGVMGERGAGAVDHFGLQKEIHIQMGTLSKALGSFGAYCCGSHDLVEYLIHKARSFIYTTALPPAVAAAALKGIDIIAKEPMRRQQLWDNTYFVLDRLRKMGYDTLESQTPIIPIVLGDANAALRFSRKLFEAGIYAAAIRPPTVPENMARVRLSIMATHTRGDLEYLLKTCRDILASM